LEKVSKGKNVIRMTATDGHRLSLINREMKEEISLEKGIIIPKKGVQEIKRIIEEIKEEEIFLSFTGNTGIVKTKNGVLIIHLIEAEFPDYEKFLPEEQKNSLVLEKNKFVNALRRISTLATQETHSILIKLKDNKIKIHSNNPEFGEAVEEMDIEYKKDKIDIGFNVMYLMDVLKIIKSDHVEFSFNDNMGPVTITDNSDKDFLSIIMPINFK
jgi:DNA polymerase-3 subunit beta